MSKSESKPKLGRPSTYDAKYCEILLECLSEGGNMDRFSVLIKKPPTTIYAWISEHSEFYEAYTQGMAASRDCNLKKLEGYLTDFTPREFNHHAANNLYDKRFAQKYLYIPGWNSFKTWGEKCHAVLNMAASHQMHLDNAQQILKCFESTVNCERMDEMQADIDKLKEMLSQLQTRSQADNLAYKD